MIRTRLLSTFAVLTLLVAIARQGAGQPSAWWFTLHLDGGYGFIRTPNREMQVVTLASGGHPMKLSLTDRGKYVGVITGTEPPKDSSNRWDLAGYDVYIDSAGDAKELTI